MVIRRFNRVSELAVLVGVVIVAAGVFKVYQTADAVHHAVCALRAERIKGIVQAQTFLQKHPNGIKFKDEEGHTVRITRDDQLRQIEQQKVTVRAFRFADC